MDNKEIVRRFYQEFFNGHDVDAALRYVREDYIQHNPGVAQGRAGLMEGFREKFRTEPDFHLELQMLIAEGDKVAVYLKNVGPAGNTRARVVDIYRLSDGLLAEHWDVLQPV